MDEITALVNLFASPSDWRRVVFWYDPDGDQDREALSRALEQIQVKLWELSAHNVLETKYQLEVVDPESSYVVYAPFAHPAPENNWLLDMELYGQVFEADRLGLVRTRLRLHQVPRNELERHARFFQNQERVRRLERLLPEAPSITDMQNALLAVLANQPSPNPGAILGALLWTDEGDTWEAIGKFYGAADFWAWVRQHWGIPETVDQLSTLQEVLIANHLRVQIPGFEGALPAVRVTKPHACRMLMEDWLGHLQTREAMRPMLARIVREWNLAEGLRDYDVVACDTVPWIDEWLLHQAALALVHAVDQPDRWLRVCEQRRTTAWADEWATGYRAVGAAWRLEAVRRSWENHRPVAGASVVTTYAEALYRVDQAYRAFAVAVQRLHHPEWLEAAWTRLDNWYTHHFLPDVADWIATAWPSTWFSENVIPQPQFYGHFLARHVAKSAERMFVIISDALRYEAGVELRDRLMQWGGAERVTVTPMQATLPTYTQLGMASLLPGRTLGITDQGIVLRDQRSTQGLEHRAAVLKAYNPTFDAMRLEDLLALPVKDGLERVRGLRVVYLYHDTIDAIGDKSATEAQTFEAVETALRQLTGGVEKLVRSYQAARIFITADHGFLFQAHLVASWNKVPPVTGAVVDGNHRFALGRALAAPPGCQKWDLSYLGWTGWDAVIPQGLGRFGGAGGGTRFVHGGPMPQEAVVPVIEYRPLRSREAGRSGPVDIEVATQQRVVTSYAFRVKLFQKQRVSPQRARRMVQVALYWEGHRISNATTLVCDASGEVSDRYYDVTLTLHEAAYPPGDRAELRLVDVTGDEPEDYLMVPVELRIFPA